jgi:hypothetical protein
MVPVLVVEDTGVSSLRVTTSQGRARCVLLYMLEQCAGKLIYFEAVLLDGAGALHVARLLGVGVVSLVHVSGVSRGAHYLWRIAGWVKGVGGVGGMLDAVLSVRKGWAAVEAWLMVIGIAAAWWRWVAWVVIGKRVPGVVVTL